MDESKKSIQTRERIIAAALRTYAKYGQAETSTRKIADAAGIGKSTIYEYFPSLDALYEESLARLISGMSAGREALRVLARRDPKTALESYLNHAEHTALYEPDALLLTAQFLLRETVNAVNMNNAKTEYRQKMLPASEELFSDFEALFRSGIDEGIFQPTCHLDAPSLALITASLIREIQANAFLYDTEQLKKKIASVRTTLSELLGIEWTKQTEVQA